MDWNVFFINNMETIFAKLAIQPPPSLWLGYDLWDVHYWIEPALCGLPYVYSFTQIACYFHNNAVIIPLINYTWVKKTKKVLSALPTVLKFN